MKVFLENTEEKRQLRRPRRAWEYNIKVNIREI